MRLVLINESQNEAIIMKKICTSTLSCLATLLLISTFVYGAEPQRLDPVPHAWSLPLTAERIVNPAFVRGAGKIPLFDVMTDLMDGEVAYCLTESALIVMTCNPFSRRPGETRFEQPVGDFSVGLKFSF